MYVLYILYMRITRILCILRIISYDLLYDLGYHSSSYGLIGSIVACAMSINFLSSALSSCDTYLIRSITLTSSFLSLSLKTSIISKLLIKGTVLSFLFTSIYTKWFIMPKYPLLLQSQQYTKTVMFILLSSKVILLCSCCVKKGLVYITIAAPSGY